MKLSIVATPIGNLEDVSLRALRAFKEADVILCEDTRVTKKLLGHYGIQKPLLSYHQHSKPRRWEEIRRLLERGKALALVSDAGTPGINDPGNELIAYLVHTVPRHSEAKPKNLAEDNTKRSFTSFRMTGEALEIIPIPGPNAAVTALSISGFPADRFLFLGYPPPKRKRQKFFAEIAAASVTVVFYESPHRILRTLEELAHAIGERAVAVARELTKKFEMVYRGTAQEVRERLKVGGSVRGEFVVVVGPRSRIMNQE